MNMKLIKDNVQVCIDKNLGEISSIKIDNVEILYQGNEGWKKTFPILFPVVGMVKAWKINEKTIDLAKHGFWRDLKWNAFYDNDDLVLTTICNSKKLPYIFDIHFRIIIKKSNVTLSISITNASTENAYFHFGWHPAFIIDNTSSLILDKNVKPAVINLEGAIEANNLQVVHKKNINQIPFGNNMDTLIFEENKITNITLKNKLYKLNLYFDSPSLLLWKKPNDNFICIEPYYGYSDYFLNDFKPAIKDKKDIVKLNSLDTFKSVYVIIYKKNKS